VDPPLLSSKGVLGVHNYNHCQKWDKSLSGDPLPVAQYNGSALNVHYREIPETGDKTSVIAFGAHFSSISIRDCDKVKLKGVC